MCRLREIFIPLLPVAGPFVPEGELKSGDYKRPAVARQFVSQYLEL